MRLHIGAGHYYWPGFTNVDYVGDQDLVTDITDLPYEDDSVDEIHGIHVFEHLQRYDAVKALNEWYRVLKPGGKLVLEMPSLEKIAQLIVDGEKNPRLTTMGLFGDPRDPNKHMAHQWGWAADELLAEMWANGFDAEVLEPVFHLKKRDMRCVAIKNPERKA